MKNFIIWGALTLGLVGNQGCVTAEAKNEISTNAAASDGVLRLWDTLTPEQQHTAYWKQARAWHNLDYAVNGVEIPAEYLGDGVAPVESGQ